MSALSTLTTGYWLLATDFPRHSSLEQRPHRRLELVDPAGALEAGPEMTGAVEDIGHRDGAFPILVEDQDYFLRITGLQDIDGKGGLLLPEEGRHHGGRLLGIIHRETHDRHAPAPIGLLETDQLGKLHHARPAPCRPHI